MPKAIYNDICNNSHLGHCVEKKDVHVERRTWYSKYQ